MELKFVCLDAVTALREFPLTQFPLTVGRGQEADIRIDDCWASRQHSEFDLVDGQLVVRDLRSSNGTLVNNHPITDLVALHPGDRVTVGITTFELVVNSPVRSGSSPEMSIA